MIASLLLASLLASASGENPSAACPSIPELPTLACVSTEDAWFYAASPETAAQAAHDGMEAMAVFRQHFGQEAPFGAVVLADEFSKEGQDDFIARHSLGYLRLWVPPESKAVMLEESIRKRMPSLPDEQIRALAQRASQGAGGGNVLRHEIGHSLYRAAYWPQHVADDAMYGTPAPDWLDEASAILLEPEPVLAERRAHFRNRLREDSTLIRPLGEFLDASHPLATAYQRGAGLVAQGGSQTGTGITMAVMAGDDAKELPVFYFQSLAVADFLIEASGETTLLGDISMAMANGATFEEWLAGRGSPYRLGPDIGGLEQQWNAWLDSLL